MRISSDEFMYTLKKLKKEILGQIYNVVFRQEEWNLFYPFCLGPSSVRIQTNSLRKLG